jgi:DNA-binding Lrp family transcriptional regulator
MIQDGMIKRFGVVVRHHELGYRSNAMVVFDLPDDVVDGIGARLAAEPGVTLCYRRRRSLPDWPYNLYCMVHGRSRDEAQPVIERLVAIAGAPATVLFSTRRFKQCGARYFSDHVADRHLVEPGHA